MELVLRTGETGLITTALCRFLAMLFARRAKVKGDGYAGALFFECFGSRRPMKMEPYRYGAPSLSDDEDPSGNLGQTRISFGPKDNI